MKKILQTLGKALGLAFMLAASQAGADVVTISGSITASTTWFATNTYHLVGKVYVQTGANLSIEPGTLITCKTFIHKSSKHFCHLTNFLFSSRHYFSKR